MSNGHAYSEIHVLIDNDVMNLHVFQYMLYELHHCDSLGGWVLVIQSTCSISSDYKLW